MTLPRLFAILSIVFLGCPAFAQITLPQGAHVDLFFPHVADGGEAAQRWQTSFFFVHPANPIGPSGPATRILGFFGQDGQPLVVTLGTATASTFSISVPAGGSVSFRTSGAGPLRVGWAYAALDKPVQGNAAYRVLVNERPRQEVSVNAVLPTPRSWNYASAFSGIAIANPWAISLTVIATLKDASGRTAAIRQVTLGPGRHMSRVVWEWFGVPLSFVGSIIIRFEAGPSYPIVLVINGDSEGIISSVPSGHVAGFTLHEAAIRTAFAHLVSTLNLIQFMDIGSPRLQVQFNRDVNAFATSDGTVIIEVGLAQLFGSMDGLAFIVGHELGHIYQFRNGAFLDPTNKEFDADLFGLFAILFSGYDPYAAGGALGKLMMATGRGSLITTIFEDLTAGEAHRSFSTRISELYATIELVCKDQAACQNYNRVVHPNVPGPLRDDPRPAILAERIQAARRAAASQ